MTRTMLAALALGVSAGTATADFVELKFAYTSKNRDHSSGNRAKVATIGTMGEGRRLQQWGVEFAHPIDGLGIRYRAHWPDGNVFTGENGRIISDNNHDIDAVAIELFGPKANQYVVSYMVHVAEIGNVTVPAVNGAWTISKGGGKPVEGVVVCVLPKSDLAALPPGALPSYILDAINGTVPDRDEQPRRPSVTGVALSIAGGVVGAAIGPEIGLGPTEGSMVGSALGYAVGAWIEKEALKYRDDGKPVLPVWLTFTDAHAAQLELGIKAYLKHRDAVGQKLGDVVAKAKALGYPSPERIGGELSKGRDEIAKRLGIR